MINKEYLILSCLINKMMDGIHTMNDTHYIIPEIVLNNAHTCHASL